MLSHDENLFLIAMERGWGVLWKGSHDSLAQEVGVHQTTITRLLKKKISGSAALQSKIAKAFGFPDLAAMLAYGRGEDPNYLLPGHDQVKLPAWDQRELSRLEREHLEMALAVLRSSAGDGGEAARLLRLNIKAAHKSINPAALEERLDDFTKPSPADGKGRKKAAGGA